MSRPNWRNYRRMIIRRGVFRVLCVIGAGMCIFGFFYLIGIAGHCDFESEAGYCGEIWSLIDYVRHIIESLLIIGIGSLASMVGDYFENLTSDWIDHFETKWNVSR